MKIRDGHTVRNQACYVALGVNLDGERDVLGLWFQQTEGAKFWLHVLTDLKTRGVADILFGLRRRADRLPGGDRSDVPARDRPNLPGAPGSLQHAVRVYKDRSRSPPTCAGSTPRVDAEHAADELQAFAEKWDHRYPMISASWLEHWEQITPFLAYPAEVRRVIYTTNSIEALHRPAAQDHQVRGHFPRPRTPPEAHLPRHPEGRGEVEARVSLAGGIFAAFKIEFGDRIPDSAM